MIKITWLFDLESNTTNQPACPRTASRKPLSRTNLFNRAKGHNCLLFTIAVCRCYATASAIVIQNLIKLLKRIVCNNMLVNKSVLDVHEVNQIRYYTKCFYISTKKNIVHIIYSKQHIKKLKNLRHWLQFSCLNFISTTVSTIILNKSSLLKILELLYL